MIDKDNSFKDNTQIIKPVKNSDKNYYSFSFIQEHKQIICKATIIVKWQYFFYFFTSINMNFTFTQVCLRHGAGQAGDWGVQNYRGRCLQVDENLQGREKAVWHHLWRSDNYPCPWGWRYLGLCQNCHKVSFDTYTSRWVFPPISVCFHYN